MLLRHIRSSFQGLPSPKIFRIIFKGAYHLDGGLYPHTAGQESSHHRPHNPCRAAQRSLLLDEKARSCNRRGLAQHSNCRTNGVAEEGIISCHGL
jgi:hypothetical protein